MQLWATRLFQPRQNPEGLSAENNQLPMFPVAAGHLDRMPQELTELREVKWLT